MVKVRTIPYSQSKNYSFFAGHYLKSLHVAAVTLPIWPFIYLDIYFSLTDITAYSIKCALCRTPLHWAVAMSSYYYYYYNVGHKKHSSVF